MIYISHIDYMSLLMEKRKMKFGEKKKKKEIREKKLLKKVKKGEKEK